MRNSNLNVYKWFTANPGVKISPKDLFDITGVPNETSAGGVPAHVLHMRNVNGLNIISEKQGREVLSYRYEPPKNGEGEYILPEHDAEVDAHYARIERIRANKLARSTKLTAEEKAARKAARKANKTDSATAAIDAAIAATAAAVEADTTPQTVPETPVVEMTKEEKRKQAAIKAAATRAANKAAKLAASEKPTEDTLGEVLDQPLAEVEVPTDLTA